MDERVSQAARGLLCGNRAAVARRRAFLLGSLLVAVWACSPSTAFATGSVTLGWDANVEPNIAGYTVYYRSADNYSHGTVTVGGVGTTTATLSNLRSAVRYYFSVSAFDSMGLSSSPSSEVSGIVPGQPDSTPGTPD